jgi:AcrR family transcriptional regulator
MKTERKKSSPKNQKLDRETWLARSLEALASKGPQVLAVEKLCRTLGVSRGSFYWHFKSRADFVQQLAKFWDQRFTVSLTETVASAPNGPGERLLLLSELIQDLDVIRFDVAVRAWASVEPLAARIVRTTDQTRYQFVRAMFAELGFAGDDLEMRTRTFVIFYSFDGAFSFKEGTKAMKRQRLLRYQMLIRKSEQTSG